MPSKVVFSMIADPTRYGFPLHSGGPMCCADPQGAVRVVPAMKELAATPLDDAAFWQPAPLQANLVADGRTFT